MTLATPRRRRARLTISLLAATFGLIAGLLPGASPARAATLKAVIIVGPTGSLTSYYERDADDVAAAAAAHGMSVTKLYTPHASWSAVAGATAGANLVYFAGHGNGFPNPYIGFLQPQYNDGYGLDPSPNGDTPTYYGESRVADVKLAPDAIVLLNHLCYAPGASEPGNPAPSATVARQRIDNFAAGFLAAGAGAVFADDNSTMDSLVNALFTSSDATTVDNLFEQVGFHGGDDRYFSSSRTSWARVHMDPDSSSLIYRHSLAGDLSMTVGNWKGDFGPPAPPPPANAHYNALNPVRVLDSRSGVGLKGDFRAGVPRVLQVAGVGAIPDDAVAVTLNVTVVGQTAAGYVSLTPAADSTPATSTLNFPTDDVRANGVTVPLNADGTLAGVYIAAAGNTTDLVIDVTGAWH
jgi:hypothetical protein